MISGPNEPPYGRTDIAVGTLIEGRYEILAKIGEGAQGTVFRARDRRLGIDVALKALAADPDDDTLVSRFQREVEMLTRLRHPNIVTVSDCHDWHGRPYYVMELCGDGDVMRLINSRVPLTLARIAEIGRSVAFGLQAAHALRPPLVHCDLKPANVLFAGDIPKVVDFGIAKAVGESKSISRTDLFVGTIRYASPEQVWDRRTVVPASDLWSLGVVLFELATWARPFDRPGEGWETIVHRITHGQPLPPPFPLPAGLAALLHLAFIKDPRERIASAAAFAAALDTLARSPEAHAVMLPPASHITEIDREAARCAAAFARGALEEAREVVDGMRLTDARNPIVHYWDSTLRQSAGLVMQRVAPHSGPDLERQEADAERARARGDLEEVVRIWAGVVREFPGLARAEQLLLVAQHELKLERRMRSAIEVNRQAVALKAQGDIDGAIRVWEEHVRIHGIDDQAQAELLLLAADRNRRASEMAEETSRLASQHAEVAASQRAHAASLRAQWAELRPGRARALDALLAAVAQGDADGAERAARAFESGGEDVPSPDEREGARPAWQRAEACWVRAWEKWSFASAADPALGADPVIADLRARAEAAIAARDGDLLTLAAARLEALVGAAQDEGRWRQLQERAAAAPAARLGESVAEVLETPPGELAPILERVLARGGPARDEIVAPPRVSRRTRRFNARYHPAELQRFEALEDARAEHPPTAEELSVAARRLLPPPPLWPRVAAAVIGAAAVALVAAWIAFAG